MPETAPTVHVHHGDARSLPLADASIDAIVCDPPYELAFMGRAWDATGVAYDIATWREAHRVLKPGGYLLAFGGSRTWHRLAVAIEDVGFELRDSIAWLYGSGFPKSLDVSKAIDKQRNDTEAVLRVTTWLADLADERGITRAQVDTHMGTSDMGGWWLSRLPHRCALPTPDQWERLRALLDFGTEMDAEVWRLNGRKGTPGEAWSQREVIGEVTTRRDGGSWADQVGSGMFQVGERTITTTAPATDDARRWQGWGTALKPGFEPIVVARKPLVGTVAQNVLAHGTGALNIDGCRTEHANAADLAASMAKNPGRADTVTSDVYGAGRPQQQVNTAGRWPTNVVLSHPPLLDDGGEPIGDACADGCAPGCPVAELGDAARYFPVFRYQAKAPTRERPRVDGVAHPTVKPLDLMRWLVRLVTPPGGLVLDPFAGSGTTLEAALLEGFDVYGVEKAAEHLPLIRFRVDRAWAQLGELAKAAAAKDEAGPTLLDLLAASP